MSETKPKMSARDMAAVEWRDKYSCPGDFEEFGQQEAFYAGHTQGLKEREDEVEKRKASNQNLQRELRKEIGMRKDAITQMRAAKEVAGIRELAIDREASSGIEEKNSKLHELSERAWKSEEAARDLAKERDQLKAENRALREALELAPVYVTADGVWWNFRTDPKAKTGTAMIQVYGDSAVVVRTWHARVTKALKTLEDET